jgi:hypothetical protein
MYVVLTSFSFLIFLMQLQKIGSQLKQSFTVSRMGDILLFQSQRYGFQVMWDAQESIKISVSEMKTLIFFILPGNVDKCFLMHQFFT